MIDPETSIKKGILLACILLAGCSTQQTTRLSPPELISHQPPTAIAPPTYVEVIDEDRHPDFDLAVAQVNLPLTTVENAIIAAMPHPVSIRYSHRAHANKQISLRVLKGASLTTLIDALRATSGYDIRYDPIHRVVDVAALVSRNWYLPTLVGRGETTIELGGSGDDGDDDEGSNDENTGDNGRTITTTFDSTSNPAWDQVVAQTNCILETPVCSGSSNGDEEDASALGQPAEDGSFLTTNLEQGLLTVVATPEKMRYLSAWLNALAKQTSRYIRLRVVFLSVRATDNAQRGLDLISALLTADDGNFGITYENTLEQGANQALTGGKLSINAGLLSGDVALSAILSMIDENLDAEVTHEATLIVPSGETGVVSAVETFYFSGGSEIFTGTVNQQQTLETNLEQGVVGIELAITPRFLTPASDNNLISIRLMPSISSLVGFDQVISNGVVASEAPRIARNNFTSHAIVRDGNALVVGGLTSAVTETVDHSISFLPLLGANRQLKSNAELVIIVLAQEVEA